jgi:hypothetical protein
MTCPKVFLTLTHYSLDASTSTWYIPNGGNTGIGNMLFQIASAWCYALKHQAKLYVPGLETFFRLENLKKEESIFRNVCSDCPPEYLAVKDAPVKMTTTKKNIWEYEFADNIHFSEYFENFQNIAEKRALIQEMFGPTPEDIAYITKRYPQILDPNICSIHVRLGPDYKLIFRDNHARLEEIQKTYFKCIDHVIKEKGVKKFFVFTNDREYCRYIFDNNLVYISHKVQFFYSYERDFMDVWMISLIKMNIVSVSTLAWWGSFLNKHPDQYVVCHKGCRDDLHYPGWVFI